MELIEGIVLNTRKYQENSKLIYVITKESLMTLLVKASCSFTSKNYACAQELIKINFSYSESKRNSFNTLTSYEIVDTYKFVKDKYNVIKEILDILNIIYRYYEHISVEKITDRNNVYNLLNFYLNKINLLYSDEYKDNIDKIDYLHKMYKIIFLEKMLYLLGVGPNVYNCTVCSLPNAYNFSISSGGVVCEKCKTKDSFSGTVVGVFKVLYLGKLEIFDYKCLLELPNCVEELQKIIKLYYERYLSIRI